MKRAAPCKINLCLDVVRRRPDGYHDLRGVMQTVSLSDTVTVEEQAAGFTLLADLDLPAGKRTLEEQAAEAFFVAAGVPVPGLRVTLDKTVPVWAGLGGGSADVAALLRLLRDRYAPEMSTAELERVGFQTGSDMPFCIRGGTCLAEGRGELLTDLPPLPVCFVVLCKPPYGLPTGGLFAALDRIEIRRRPDTDGMVRAIEQGNLNAVAERLCNVFEEAVPEAEYPDIFAIKDRLREYGALNACMSGSGPTVFGLFRERETAQNAAAALGRDYRETYLAEPVGRL